MTRPRRENRAPRRRTTTKTTFWRSWTARRQRRGEEKRENSRINSSSPTREPKPRRSSSFRQRGSKRLDVSTRSRTPSSRTGRAPRGATFGCPREGPREPRVPAGPTPRVARRVARQLAQKRTRRSTRANSADRGCARRRDDHAHEFRPPAASKSSSSLRLRPRPSHGIVVGRRGRARTSASSTPGTLVPSLKRHGGGAAQSDATHATSTHVVEARPAGTDRNVGGGRRR